MKRLKACNPVWFVKASLSYMGNNSNTWRRMPWAYVRFCFFTPRNRN